MPIFKYLRRQTSSLIEHPPHHRSSSKSRSSSLLLRPVAARRRGGRCSWWCMAAIVATVLSQYCGGKRGGSVVYCSALFAAVGGRTSSSSSALTRRIIIVSSSSTTTKRSGGSPLLYRSGRIASTTTGSSSSSSRAAASSSSGGSSSNNDSSGVNGEGGGFPWEQQQKQQRRYFSKRRQQERPPQTGWTHKQPSNDSNFWKGPNQPNQGGSTNRPSEPTNNNKQRTGWLHFPNKSRSEAARNKKEEEGKRRKQGQAKRPANMARRRLELAKLQQERNHRMLGPPSLHACGEDRVVVVTEHLISVPVYRNDESNNKGNDRIDVYFSIVERIIDEKSSLFFRNELSSTELSASQRAQQYLTFSSLQNAGSCVLYLQGGPGFGAPTPGVGVSLSKGSGSWLDAALHTHGYQRIVLMDQRGTGRSTPITKQTLERQFPNLFLLDDADGRSDDMPANSRSLDEDFDDTNEQVKLVRAAVDEATEYLAQFRADNIVQDAEYIREALMAPESPEEEEKPAEPRPWGCSIGQSYGGFCQMTYLSQVEYPPKIMLFTGGIAPMLTDVKEAYGMLWERVRERSLRYYEMYPGDISLVHKIVQRLIQEPVVLPSGGRLTARRFLSLGISLGGSPGAFTAMHDLISTAFVGGASTAAKADNIRSLDFTRAFLKQIDSQQSFDDHPIYFWLHESIYADGPDRSTTNWAAYRAYEEKAADEAAAFDYYKTSAQGSDCAPTLFFGEHVFPWMPEDFAELSGVGLRAMANALASKSDWGPLYDGDHMRMVLGDGRTQSAASVYHEDMYVEFDACMKVTARGGPLDKCKLFVTNEYQHSGLRDGGASLFSKLHGMAKGGIRTPS